RVAEVILVTACPVLAEAGVRAASAYCSRLVFRENLGRDFGAFRVGLARAGDLAARQELILTNDSVYGPLADLVGGFSDMERRADLDLWGLTNSWDVAYHLQSYFLVFRTPFLQSRFFRDFWESFSSGLSRRDVIIHYEIGFSQRALREGFKLGAVCEY